jgi:ABC-type polysaccharide/polyol phosphate export permease
MRAAVVVTTGSLLFHVSYAAGNAAAGFAVFLLTLCALYTLGMLLGSLFLFYGRDAWQLSSALQEPVYLLAGLYFPVRALGGFAGVAVSLLPLATGLDAMRQLLLPGSPQLVPIAAEVALLVAQTALFGALAGWALRVIENRARAQGRLIARWS